MMVTMETWERYSRADERQVKVVRVVDYMSCHLACNSEPAKDASPHCLPQIRSCLSQNEVFVLRSRKSPRMSDVTPGNTHHHSNAPIRGDRIPKVRLRCYDRKLDWTRGASAMAMVDYMERGVSHGEYSRGGRVRAKEKPTEERSKG
jgi:hypothetical protein